MEKVEFVNLTPHQLNVHDNQGNVITLPSSGKVRLSTEYKKVETVHGIDIFTCEYGEIEGLPEPQDGKIYVVSGLVKQAVPNRRDVVSPGELVRDEHGRPVGCRGLRR